MSHGNIYGFSSHRREEPGSFYRDTDLSMPGALSSAWTEHLASDQDAAGSNPAAPIILRDGQHLADGSTTFIKEPLFGRFDFITFRDGGRRCHAIRQHLIDSMGT
jgi:hypothetical protein